MRIKKIGREILKNHKKFYDKLIKIPKSRKIVYREEINKGRLIGKPRFEKKKYQWDEKLQVELRNHLQEVWNFFDQFSYWFDESIKDIIQYEKRRISKKSVIFLLENDVWETDEVFGDYLIEEMKNKTTIYYFRFEKKFKKFDFPNMYQIIF